MPVLPLPNTVYDRFASMLTKAFKSDGGKQNKTKQKTKTDEGIHLKTKAVAEKKNPKNGRMINKKKKKQNSFSAVVYGNQRGGEKHKRKHKQN